MSTSYSKHGGFLFKK